MAICRKTLCLILVAAMMLSSVPFVYGATNEAYTAANELYKLGLFNGTGLNADGTPNFDLDRAPTRHEAITMLVALLGKGKDAQRGYWTTPFTDVADWAKPYVGYAYANSLTSGTSATTYSGNKQVTAAQFITFVLSALGYRNGEDFQWDRSWEFSDTLGITDGRYSANTKFTRGDAAIISYNALNAVFKGTDKTLRTELLSLDSVQDAIVLNDLQGYWKSKECDNEFERYYRIWGDTITDVQYFAFDDGSHLYDYYSGTFTVEKGVFRALYTLDSYYGEGSRSYVEKYEFTRVANFTLKNDTLTITGVNDEGESYTSVYVRDKGAEASVKAIMNMVDSHIVTVTDESMRKDIIGSWSGTTYDDDESEWLEFYTFTKSGYSAGWTKWTPDGDLLLTVYEEGTYTIKNGSMKTSSNRIYYWEDENTSDTEDGSREGELEVYGDLMTWRGWDYDRTDAGTVKDTLDFYRDYIQSNDRSINQEEYSYLVGSDFRRIRREYSTATPVEGYAYTYYNMDGHLCTLTFVMYRIIDLYTEFVLHDHTAGTYSRNPEEHYSKYNAHELALAQEVLHYEMCILKDLSGEQAFDGVYVNASTLAL